MYSSTLPNLHPANTKSLPSPAFVSPFDPEPAPPLGSFCQSSICLPDQTLPLASSTGYPCWTQSCPTLPLPSSKSCQSCSPALYLKVIPSLPCSRDIHTSSSKGIISHIQLLIYCLLLTSIYLQFTPDASEKGCLAAS